VNAKRNRNPWTDFKAVQVLPEGNRFTFCVALLFGCCFSAGVGAFLGFYIYVRTADSSYSAWDEKYLSTLLGGGGIIGFLVPLFWLMKAPRRRKHRDFSSRPGGPDGPR